MDMPVQRKQNQFIHNVLAKGQQPENIKSHEIVKEIKKQSPTSA